MNDDNPTTNDSDDPEAVRRAEMMAEAENANTAIGPLVRKWNLEASRLSKQTETAHEYGEVVLWHRWVDANLSSAIRAHFVPETNTAANLIFD
jgi:hypothetical protein